MEGHDGATEERTKTHGPQNLVNPLEADPVISVNKIVAEEESQELALMKVLSN